MKYAVIRTGGKQYRVSEGDVVKVEKLPGAVGEKITLADVLFVGGNGEVKIGSPLVSISPVTVAFDTKGEPILTSPLPPTKSTSAKVIFSPTSPGSFSTLTTSPSDTRYCLPPVLITAYFIGIS